MRAPILRSLYGWASSHNIYPPQEPCCQVPIATAWLSHAIETLYQSYEHHTRLSRLVMHILIKLTTYALVNSNRIACTNLNALNASRRMNNPNRKLDIYGLARRANTFNCLDSSMHLYPIDFTLCDSQSRSSGPHISNEIKRRINVRKTYMKHHYHIGLH